MRTRRVVVVGAGVAGLEAAWVAAARGHEVTVLGRSREAGGKARLRASLPEAASFLRPGISLDQLQTEAKRFTDNEAADS